MSESSHILRISGEGRKFSWMPVLDGYIFRSFMVPFCILLFAFTLLFIIMDMYNEIGDFLDNRASVSVSVHFFLLKIPGNIRFILPITVLLACMYALANLGRNRELTAIRASGISLVRCGLPIFTIGFCVMLVNFYFNEYLVPETTRQADIVKETLDNPDYVEQTNARLQFHSGDQLRQWYFGQFNDDGYQEKVKLKLFIPHPEDSSKRKSNKTSDIFWPRITIQAEKTRFVPGDDGKPGFWEFYMPDIHEYPDDAGNTQQGNKDLENLSLDDSFNGLTKAFAKTNIKVDCFISAETKTVVSPENTVPEANPEGKETIGLELTLTLSENDKPNITKSENVPFSLDELRVMEIATMDENGKPLVSNQKIYSFTKLLISEEIIPDKPSVIIKSVIDPEALSSLEIIRILRDNPRMAKNLKYIYATILFNRLAFPWACFLCAFFALPLATKNERSGIFTAIATAVGIAVLYQVSNEIFMVAGKNGYLSIDALEALIHFPLGPFLAGVTPTVLFGGYGFYLLKKVG